MGVVQHGAVQGICCARRPPAIYRLFAIDDPNFDAGLARTVSNHGGKAYLNEVDMIDASIAAI
jgi:hypothetical protein